MDEESVHYVAWVRMTLKVDPETKCTQHAWRRQTTTPDRGDLWRGQGRPRGAIQAAEGVQLRRVRGLVPRCRIARCVNPMILWSFTPSAGDLEQRGGHWRRSHSFPNLGGGGLCGRGHGGLCHWAGECRVISMHCGCRSNRLRVPANHLQGHHDGDPTNCACFSPAP